MTLTQKQIRSLFYYKDGNLYWKVSNSNRIKIGDIAGSVRKNGRRDIGINGKLYLAHRLIFLYHYGFLPQFLDHIDGNRLNNNISNLREATNQENQMNKKKTKSYDGKSTSSEFKGVSWHERSGKWQTRIKIDGKSKYLGLFISEIEAAKTYNNAAIDAFGEFAKLNEVTNKCL